MYFIGDSNALVFRHLLVDEPAYFGKPITTVGCYVPGLAAESIVRDGVLDERVARFLRQDVLVRPSDVGLQNKNVADNVYERALLGGLARPLDDQWDVEAEPVVVLLLGTVDLMKLASRLGPAADFVLDDPRFNAAAFERPELPLFPSLEIQELVRSQVAPVAQAIDAIRALGVEQLYVHAIMPPTLDDADFFRVRGVMCSAKLRYKLALLLNGALREVATRGGAGFIDLWPQVTVDNVRDPAFAFDADHGNRAAAALTIKCLSEDLVLRRSRSLPASVVDNLF